jgi:superfamily II DNA or RNA helicase
MTAAQRDLFASQEPPGGTQPPSLRPHQAVALQRLLGAFQRVRGALVCHGTGLGKTRLAGAAAWEFKLRGLRVLMICPTIEITRQCYEAMRALGLSATIEQADNRATRPLPDVTVACVATLRKTRLRGFRPDDFGLLIVDECHAAVAARYRAIVDYFASAKLLGVTATADRTDGLSLANVFDEVAHEMSMLEGIQQGYLAPLKFKTAITDFDAKKLRTMAGDVSAGSVEAELTRSGALHEAASTLAELAPIERTVAFLPTVASSKAFVGELLAKGVKALHVDGTTPSDVRKFYFAQIKA